MSEYEKLLNTVTMYHINMAINHAVKLAAEGTDLLALASMDNISGVSEETLKHAQDMVSKASKLIPEVMAMDAIQFAYNRGARADTSEEMAYVHNLAAAAGKYIALLENMPPPPSFQELVDFSKQ